MSDMKTAEDIRIRDPFVLPVSADKIYYLFGTTDVNTWDGPGIGLDCYRSADLLRWEGPIPAFRPPAGFWATKQFWAPEVHEYQGRFYMFATFKAPRRFRGTQILASDSPEGPYAPLTAGPVTPGDWECLDGTLHVAQDGRPWMVFCHEWTQIHNGAICAMALTDDLLEAAGRPVFLFNASEATWARPIKSPSNDEPDVFPSYVTDGPFMYRTKAGSLLMLWSSCGDQGYTMGIARSRTGRIEGDWTQDAEPLWSRDGGHGMLFRTFDGRLMLTFHSPNRTPDERMVLMEAEDMGDAVKVKKPESDKAR